MKNVLHPRQRPRTDILALLRRGIIDRKSTCVDERVSRPCVAAAVHGERESMANSANTAISNGYKIDAQRTRRVTSRKSTSSPFRITVCVY